MRELNENITFPEGLQEFLDDNAVECPPIPLALFPFLQERNANFFATSWNSISRPFLFMEDIENFLADEQEESGMQEKDYAGFGLSGYGLQNKYFNYFLQIKGLTLAVSLPWGAAYADQQAEQDEFKAACELIEMCIKLASQSEQDEFKAACELIEMCIKLASQSEQGQDEQNQNKGQLSLLINAGSCQWKWVDENAVHEGDTLLSLVEFFEQHIDSTDIPPYMWTRV